MLFLTDVPSWSPHAVFQATRLFVSSLNSRLVRPARPRTHSAGAFAFWSGVRSLDVNITCDTSARVFLCVLVDGILYQAHDTSRKQPSSPCALQ